ncbi:hypothetical protein MKW94_014853 [Papaver nudicaule]|uniref:Uncharacterized protein n=1 Tax=Papaver nudicaule TaxID=74823 RepID=A0AA41VJK1_PAPNU|nr:hypothetical protein [Papaver nudicaule]
MEKMNLAKNLCRTAFISFAIRPMNYRLRHTVIKLGTFNDELAKEIPTYGNLVIPQKDFEHVTELTQRYGKLINKFLGDIRHFKVFVFRRHTPFLI